MKPDKIYTGRRKTAVAQLIVRPGKGNIYVNGSPLDVVGNGILSSKLSTPLVFAPDFGKTHDFFFKISGGGVVAAADAAATALAKAIVDRHSEVKEQILSYDRSLLADDPRQAEPKKPNRRSARRFRQKSYR
ncbi:MAG: 30S ribosomal protein S9 [Nitrososphaerota archaeon]